MTPEQMIQLVSKILDILTVCEEKNIDEQTDCERKKIINEASAYELIKNEFLKLKEKNND